MFFSQLQKAKSCKKNKEINEKSECALNISNPLRNSYGGNGETAAIISPPALMTQMQS